MTYFGELRRHWRPLAAASIGCGSGLMLFSYTTTTFAPFLINAFHWSRSQFALLGLTMISTLLIMPFIGRFTDAMGVRRMALLGTLLIPPCFIAFSIMQGNFVVFLLISACVLATGSLTSPIVYTRLIAENFTISRGLALTIVTCTPALLGAIAAPLLTSINEIWGWRIGYRILAAWVVIGNIIAVLLIPSGAAGARESVEPKASPGPPTTRQTGAFRAIIFMPIFWIILAAFVFCMLPTSLHSAQMSLMLADRGLTPQKAAGLISVYAIATVVGRLACGLALDQFSTRWVAMISMVLPAIGFAMIATNPGALVPIGIAMFMVGLSQGAENDLTSFLVARYFPLRIFSTTLSLVLCGVYFAAATGSLILSFTLSRSDSFVPFLAIVSGFVLVGSLLFLLLPRSVEVRGQGPDGF
jgi:MFS family permease